MNKIKDRIILGTVCALAAAAVSKALNAAEYKAGLTDIRFNQHGASIFLPAKEARSNTVGGKVIASAVNGAMVSATGAMITYMLSVTGRDYGGIKGAGVGIIQWIGIWGLLSKIGVTVKSNKPVTHILGLFDHIVFGMGTALLASRFGDDSLFPDKEARSGERLPLIALASEQSETRPLKPRKINKTHV